MPRVLKNWEWTNGGIAGDLVGATVPTRLQTARVVKIIPGPFWGVWTACGGRYMLTDARFERHFDELKKKALDPKLS